jgi:hypothetical protein
MKRRKFFNILSSAIIGTIIALNLPDNIAPIKIVEASNRSIEEIYALLDNNMKQAIAMTYKYMKAFGKSDEEILEMCV